jgi:molybdate transport system permease protein
MQTRVDFAGIPRWVIVVAAIGTAFILVPLIGMIVHVDWSHFGALITSPSSVSALVLSLETGVASTVLCIVFGVPIAIVLARGSFPGQRIVRSLVLLPLVLPPVVGGIALLYTYGRRGLLGPAFDLFGIQIGFTTAAVVLAQTFVAIPFLILSLEGALRSAGTQFEAIAATLGARPTRVLMRVTVPIMMPALVSGSILAFARALGEFGATITFAGSLQGVTQTLPLDLYFQLETDPDAAVALSLLLVAVSVLIVGLAYRGARPSRFLPGSVS